MTSFITVLVLSAQASGAPPTAPPPQELGVKSFPATFTIVCDPPARIGDSRRVDQSKLTYTVAIDRGQPSAPSATCKFTITVETPGLHHVDVVARYARGGGQIATSTPASLDFNAKLVVPPADAPAVPPPAEVHVPTPPSNAAPAQREEPPVPAPFTDPEGHRWTLVGTEVQMDGRHAPDAGACTQLILASGKVYAFGLDLWWLWRPSASPHWTNAGPNMPK